MYWLQELLLPRRLGYKREQGQTVRITAINWLLELILPRRPGYKRGHAGSKLFTINKELILF